MTSAYATSPGGYRRLLSRGVSPRPSDVSRRTHAFSAYSWARIPLQERWEYTTYVFTQLPQVARNFVCVAMMPCWL